MSEQNPSGEAETKPMPAEELAAEALWAEMDEAETDQSQPAPAGDEGDDRLPGDEDEPAQPATAGTQEQEEDIWRDAPPAAREAYEKLQREQKQLDHETRSHEGRVAARQSRIAELTQQLEAFKAKPASPEDDPLNQIATEFPELHAPISKALETLSSRQEQAEAAHKGRIEAELNAETKAYLEEIKAQTAILEKDHPGYFDFIRENAAAWQSWVDDQPKAIRDAVARNSADIVDAKAAASVISAFKAFLNPPNPAPQPSPTSDRRQRQIGSSATPSGGGRQPIVSGIPEEGDPQEIWAAFDREEARKQQR